MKESSISTSIADAALVISAADRLASIMYNYSSALNVLVDGVMQGYLQSHPNSSQFALDGDLASSVEKAIAHDLISEETFAAMNRAYEATYANLKDKATKDIKAMSQDEWVEKSLLELLPKMNKHTYARLAAKYIQEHGAPSEKGLSEVLNEAVISTHAIQGGVMVGVHRAGQAVGAMLAEFYEESRGAEVDKKAYELYCVSSYVNVEVLKALSGALALPKAIVTVIASGFVDGLLSNENDIDQQIERAKSSITSEDISMCLQENWENFEVARRVAMKKREKFDGEFVAEDILASAPQKAVKISALRGREIIANTEVGGVGVGKGALWVGDTAVSLAKAAGALGSNLLYKGFKLVGKGAKAGVGAGVSWWYGSDTPSELPRVKNEENDGKDR